MSVANAFPLPSHPFPRRGEPSWDLALMYPLQGSWTVEDYLAMDTGLLIEFTGGFVRVLPMPTIVHQLIVQLLFRALDDFVGSRALGQVFLAPLPVQLMLDKYREPDVVFVRPDRIKTIKGYPAGADLVMEVVSEGEDCRQRDYVEKRGEYAAAAIAEYWIVDPQDRVITVLALHGSEYHEQGVFRAGDLATSVLLPGFGVEVQRVFAKCEGIR